MENVVSMVSPLCLRSRASGESVCLLPAVWPDCGGALRRVPPQRPMLKALRRGEDAVWCARAASVRWRLGAASLGRLLLGDVVTLQRAPAVPH
eukprot:6709172-Prymnesium_polylepis.1